jgi:hypothetical protein
LDCGAFEAQLQRLLDLRASELDEVTAAHAAMCEPCRALATGYFQLAAIGRRSLPVAAPATISIPVERRVVDAYRGQQKPRRDRRLWYVGVSSLAAIAAGLLVAFFGLRTPEDTDQGQAPDGAAIATSDGTGGSGADPQRGGSNQLAANEWGEEPASGTMAALSRLAVERFDVAVESGRNVALAWQRLTTSEPGEGSTWPLSNVRWDQGDLAAPAAGAPAKSPSGANRSRDR